MQNKRFLAAAGVAAALGAGLVGFVGLGGVSGAQTTDSPSTTVAPDGSAPAPSQDGRHCKEDGSGGAGTGSGVQGSSANTGNVALRTRGGNFQRL